MMMMMIQLAYQPKLLHQFHPNFAQDQVLFLGSTMGQSLLSVIALLNLIFAYIFCILFLAAKVIILDSLNELNLQVS